MRGRKWLEKYEEFDKWLISFLIIYFISNLYIIIGKRPLSRLSTIKSFLYGYKFSLSLNINQPPFIKLNDQK